MSADMWVGLLFIWAAVVWLVVGMFRVANAKPRPVPPDVAMRRTISRRTARHIAEDER